MVAWATMASLRRPRHFMTAGVGEAGEDADDPLLAVHEAEGYRGEADRKRGDGGEGNHVEFAMDEAAGEVAAEGQLFGDRDGDDRGGDAEGDPDPSGGGR